MSSDALLVVKTLFTSIWSLFVSFDIPGTHTTPAEWAIFSLVFVLGVKTAKALISGNSGGSDD